MCLSNSDHQKLHVQPRDPITNLFISKEFKNPTFEEEYIAEFVEEED